MWIIEEYLRDMAAHVVHAYTVQKQRCNFVVSFLNASEPYESLKMNQRDFRLDEQYSRVPPI